jgi:hypothetical protein
MLARLHTGSIDQERSHKTNDIPWRTESDLTNHSYVVMIRECHVTTLSQGRRAFEHHSLSHPTIR